MQAVGRSADGADIRRLAIVEDHLLQRLRTEELISSQPGWQVVHSSTTLTEFVDWFRRLPPAARPHILILDLVVERGRDADPAMVAAIVRSGVRVVVLSAMASMPLVRAMMRAGVSAFVGKRDTEPDIIAAIDAAVGDRAWITPEMASVMAGDRDRPQFSIQEERVLVLYASGLTLDAVAESLGIKGDTAKRYLARAKNKYAVAGRPVRTKVDLVREAHSDGLLRIDQIGSSLPRL